MELVGRYQRIGNNLIIGEFTGKSMVIGRISTVNSVEEARSLYTCKHHLKIVAKKYTAMIGQNYNLTGILNFLRMSKRRKLYDNECIEWINSDSNLKQLFSFYESSDSIYVVLDVVACDRILFNCMYGMVDEMSNGKKVQMFLLSLVVSFSKMGILNHNLNSLGGMKFVSVSKNIKFIDAFASMTHMIEEMLMKFLSRDNEIICRKMNLQHSGVRLDYDNFKKGIFFQCK